MIMRSIIIVALFMTVTVFSTTHAAPSESHSTIQAKSQSSTIAQAMLDFINLLSSFRNIKNSGGSREHTLFGENGKVSQDELNDKSYLIPYYNMLYHLDSSLYHDAKLRDYENSVTDPTSSSYPRKTKYIKS